MTSIGFPLAVGQTITFSKELGDDPTLELSSQTLAGTADLRIIESFGV